MATGRAALLLWAQKTTEGYKGVDVKDFSLSWKNGLGFSILSSRIYSQLSARLSTIITLLLSIMILYGPTICWKTIKLVHSIHFSNWPSKAFAAAEKLGVPPLLDAEDMLIPKPEPHSVMTYLMQMHSVFVKGQASGTGWGKQKKIESSQIVIF